MSALLDLKEKIKTEALRLGFNHMGVARAVPVPEFQRYQAWIEQGYHGSMGYLAREDAVQKRGNPELILETCQRVISLAIPYRPPAQDEHPLPSGFGRVSAYAQTDDYHDRIWDKLDQLEQFIRENCVQPVKLKGYVDTGPILERSFAVTAGLGQTGKNTCLIVPGTGSYFFLAEILADLPLPVDSPYTRDLCKTCQRCITACPTQCILPDRTLDARHCISYLTIEHKGIIPDEQKALIGDWVFGCDICQTVCPHNARTPDQDYPLGENRLGDTLDLMALFDLDDAGFKQNLGGTPIERAKRVGLLRNAALVLGNQHVQAALPVLRKALENETEDGLLDALRWAIREIEKSNPGSENEVESN
ncbi:MAG: tRNA epoxyqueuosine(34) reductase QueG [Anaerolineaceae bacterium]|nr:tRNA epoxyqueuosine(34) reductase QueG [Anaerolineaceae bacterium]